MSKEQKHERGTSTRYPRPDYRTEQSEADAIAESVAGRFAPEPLDCGHVPARRGAGTGRCVTPGGKTLCYECADAAELQAMAQADVYTGYVNAAGRHFTTWPGGHLADVTSLTVSKRRTTPTGGTYRMRYVKATAPDGSRWHGAGSDNYEVITLHRDAVPCEVCGRPGRRVVDPFRADVHDEIVHRDLCPDCLQERKDDI